MPRTIATIYNIDTNNGLQDFLKNSETEVVIPFSTKKAFYSQEKRIAIAVSKLGTSTAICLGAYALALDFLDKTNMYSELIPSQID